MRLGFASAPRPRRPDRLTGDWDYESQGPLSAIIGVRSELAAGDHRREGPYDDDAALLTDLRALAERGARPRKFAQRSAALRQDHARKPSLLKRLNGANL